MGTGVTASALLWLADEGDALPASLEFLASFAFMWLLAAVLLVLIYLTILTFSFMDKSA